MVAGLNSRAIKTKCKSRKTGKDLLGVSDIKCCIADYLSLTIKLNLVQLFAGSFAGLRIDSTLTDRCCTFGFVTNVELFGSLGRVEF